MRSYQTTDDTYLWIEVAAETAAAKKGERTVVLDMREVLGITDAFVITSSTNERHAQALADSICEAVRDAGGPDLLHREGYGESQWILLDYGTFVVHVFHNDARAFYDLEYLWSDVPRVIWEEPAPLAASTR